VIHERAAAVVCKPGVLRRWHRPGVEGIAGRLCGVVFLCNCELGAHVADEVTYKDDITAQLRRAAAFSMIAGHRRLLEQAAEEIERLRHATPPPAESSVVACK
jgi:hypothetical protein